MMLTPLAVRASAIAGAAMLIAMLVLIILLQNARADEEKAVAQRDAARAELALVEQLREAEAVARAAVTELVAQAYSENQTIKEKADEVRADGGDGLSAGLGELRRIQSDRAAASTR